MKLDIFPDPGAWCAMLGMTGPSISLYLVRMISVLFPQSDILKRFHVACVTTSPYEKKTTGFFFYFRKSLSVNIS